MKLLELFKHDNIIENISIDIYESKFVFQVGIFGTTTTAVITFNRLLSMQLGNSRPWGASISINESTLEYDRLSIELQSGDLIELYGVSDFTFNIMQD